MAERADAAAVAARARWREHGDFERSFDALEEVFAFVQRAVDACAIDDGDAYAIAMTVEELFTNMVKYNAAGAGRIGIEIDCEAGAVTCRLTDPDSERFDLNAAPDADIDAPVERRRPGGLGIHLVRRLVDAIDYEYSGRCSRVGFRKRLGGGPDRDASAAASGGLNPGAGICDPAGATGESAMFDIASGDNGVIVLSGRFDAAQCDRAEQFIAAAPAAQTFDFAGLEYISSAGLGVLLRAHKRLLASGGRLRLINVNRHIHDIFRFSGFDKVFDVERAGS